MLAYPYWQRRSRHALTVHHVAGHYGASGWLVNDGTREWRDPVSIIAIDSVDAVRIRGDRGEVRVEWLEGDRPVDDLTSCTPPGLTHDAAVWHWLRAIGPARAANVTPGAIATAPTCQREAA